MSRYCVTIAHDLDRHALELRLLVAHVPDERDKARMQRELERIADIVKELKERPE
ncbi:MAG: hypothetical protein GY820_39370 [Gammaproteobacteria bacterium]|nr:hypothetical protein [Gammaproteobacteria bacterium]